VENAVGVQVGGSATDVARGKALGGGVAVWICPGAHAAITANKVRTNVGIGSMRRMCVIQRSLTAPNALELIGRSHAPPCPRPILSIHQSRQTRPASPVRSSEMLGGLSGSLEEFIDPRILVNNVLCDVQDHVSLRVSQRLLSS